jgi:hypothetical protein
MEHFTLSLDELIQYNQACEALRYDLYRQSCAFDCYPPSFELYNERCETAYQRWKLSFDTSILEDLLNLEGAHPVSAASKPPTASVQLSEPHSDSSSSMSVSSDSLSESGDVRDVADLRSEMDVADLRSSSVSIPEPMLSADYTSISQHDLSSDTLSD